VRHVIVEGKVVVTDGQLTTVSESTIYDAVKAVMPESGRFRDNLANESPSAAWLDRAMPDHGGRARYRTSPLEAR